MSKSKMFVKVGQFLRDKREAKKISQTEVADALKVKPQFVSNWERGMSSPPLRLMKPLMKMYGIPEQQMLNLLVAEHESFLRQELGLRKKRS